MKECKHCVGLFEPRRKNHQYCCGSCKTLASYKRNNYKYVSGHYQKTEDNEDVVKSLSTLPISSKNDLVGIEKKIDKLNKLLKKGGGSDSVAKLMGANIASDVAVNGLKKVFAPNTLPANKGDVDRLIMEINELKNMLRNDTIKDFSLLY